MEIDDSTAPKRLRSENSSTNSPSNPTSDLLSCPFCAFHTASQVDYDFHNHIHHQHLCSQCLHVFPSYFLLDLHMDEVHNNYFKARTYRCLIESCTKVFFNIAQRMQHVNNEHHTKTHELNQLFSLFSNLQMDETKSKEHDNKFGCDSQKTFIRNSRLRPRQFPNMNWDGDE